MDSKRTIGYYLLGKTLGQGTFGKVKLATHTLTGQKVAIKILQKQKILDLSDVQRVNRQIHILKLIRHPYIIQLYEIIETSKHLFLIMEYVQKGEVFDYIVKMTKIPEDQAAKYFKQLVSAISYLHRLNIVHRDLKPQNLLLDWGDNIKVVDFGLSNTYKSEQLLKTACGSPCYAAPEMISNKKYNGLQVDTWSCGVILFAMVCGYLPFEDPNTSALYKKILSGDYVLPTFVSEQFKDLISGILNVNPLKRLKIEEILQHSWCKSKDHNIHPSAGLIVGYHRMPIDSNILQKLKQFNFELDYAQKCIDANKHNHISTAYYLLLKKHLKNGGKSIADISSPNFDYEQIQPLKRTQKKSRIDTEIDKIQFNFTTKNQRSLEEINPDDVGFRTSLKNPNTTTSHHIQKEVNRSQQVLTKKHKNFKMYLHTNSLVGREGFFSQVKRNGVSKISYKSNPHNNNHSKGKISFIKQMQRSSLSKDKKSSLIPNSYRRRFRQADISVDKDKERQKQRQKADKVDRRSTNKYNLSPYTKTNYRYR